MYIFNINTFKYLISLSLQNKAVWYTVDSNVGFCSSPNEAGLGEIIIPTLQRHN